MFSKSVLVILCQCILLLYAEMETPLLCKPVFTTYILLLDHTVLYLSLKMKVFIL